MKETAPTFSPLTVPKKITLFLLAVLIAGFGQPAWSWVVSMAAAAIGYALIFRVILTCERKTARFWWGTCFFWGVQMIQLSWLLAHPYIYIYGIWALFAFMVGIQFGILALFITPKQIRKPFGLLALAGLWTLLEWSRLFFLSGYTWNPIGLALSANLYSLQMASIWGVYGLSFWVVFVNLLAVRAWGYHLTRGPLALWVLALMIPYCFGYAQLQIHRPLLEEHQLAEEDPYRVVLVQTGFPIEENLDFWDTKNMILFVMDEWRHILNITASHRSQSIDLMVLPEFVVPFGTWTAVYPYEKVRDSFIEIVGPDSEHDLPPLAPPFAMEIENKRGEKVWYVSNAYWLQAMANTFDTDVVAGLEDVESFGQGVREFYSAAMYFKPQQPTEEMIAANYLQYPVHRYEKRVLVPMGEYIPFSFLEDLAREYGIFGSFTCGKQAKLFEHAKLPFGVSICYEETFGDLMRECRAIGAEMLVNITSDAWFPDSRLPLQHFYHARLRTVESGIPLIRACNTGVTSGIDSLGQVVAVLGSTPTEQEWTSDSIRFEIPTYTYHTLYSRVGDGLVIGISLLAVFLALRFRGFE